MEGSVLDEAQYNQAYEVMNELHTINSDRYIIALVYAVKKRGVHTCTSYVAKKVLCYKMIHVSLLGVENLAKKFFSQPWIHFLKVHFD